MRISDWSSDVCSSDHRRLNRDPNLTQIERVSVDLLSRDRIDRRRPSFPTHLSSGTKQSKALPEDALRMLARAVIANDKDLAILSSDDPSKLHGARVAGPQVVPGGPDGVGGVTPGGGAVGERGGREG